MWKKELLRRFPVLPGIFFVLMQCCQPVAAASYEDFSGRDLLRFHIRAESNAREDQEVKMEVREEVLSYLNRRTQDITRKESMRSFVLAHREELEKLIRKRLLACGKDAVVAIYFTKEFFPMRKYGQTVVPAGIYEALRIDLGKAAGRNWWCMLYPGLCLIDPEHVLADPDDKEKLEQIFTEETPEVEYRSFFLKMWKQVTKRK